MSPYSLRCVVEADYDFLYALHVTTMRDAVDATWGWDDAFQQALFKERWDPPALKIIVVGGDDAGVLAVRKDDEETNISLIEIHPRYQRRGVGGGIIRDVLAEAHAGGEPVTLAVLRANPAAQRLYERLGFVVTEERPDRYIMRCAAPT